MRYILLSIMFSCQLLYAPVSMAASKVRLLIFISLSMPQLSLQQWLTDAHKIDAPLVMRGLVNNSFKQTIHALAPLVKHSSQGVRIDPQSFLKYDIKAVPAVVAVSHDDECPYNMSCSDNWSVVYGDANLVSVLDALIKRSNFSTSYQLQLLRAKLQGSAHA